jgi:hypothetical protein
MRSKMKKFTLVLSGILVVALLVLLADGLIIGSSLRHFSRSAQSQFPGNRIEALIALVKCESCNRRDRNNAVWALGQLGDQRALAVWSHATGETLAGIWTERRFRSLAAISDTKIRTGPSRSCGVGCCRMRTEPPLLAYRLEKVGRGEWIRTTDLLVPNQAL